jgi:glycosyltransferase involved in cell wall biosynthesis
MVVTHEPLVSVIIPAYNRAATIARALKSVLAQTVRDIEVIVVDDASTDGTLDAVRRAQDGRVRCIACDSNAGAAAARNRGIMAANASFVAFLDSDDFWAPEKLQRQLDWFATAPDDVLVICCSFRALHKGSGRSVERHHPPGTDWRLRMLDVCSVAPGSTMLAKRSVFQKVGLQYTGLRQYEDWEWLLRYLERYRLLVMPEPLASIDMHGASDPAFIQQQAECLYELRAKAIADTYGGRGRRRFRASLHVEHAVACARSGRLLRGADSIARAAVLSPSRLYALLKRGVTKAVERDF